MLWATLALCSGVALLEAGGVDAAGLRTDASTGISAQARARLRVEPPALYLPPVQFQEKVGGKPTGNTVPFESMLAKKGTDPDEAAGLANANYSLHYDYSPIFDRRALHGTNALLSMFPASAAAASGGGGGDGAATAGPVSASYLNYPDNAIRMYAVHLCFVGP
jgi:hypothetical protein